jgi:Holliday junction DNA helicase RuvA
MYEYIKGKFTEATPTHVVVENEGIGYLVHISLNTFSTIKGLNHGQLFTHVVIRHESQASSTFGIYGFSTNEERRLFLQLTSVSGVGNNTALLILSSFGPSDLMHIISSGDVDNLQKIKGIGAKTAQRIIVDLKDKLNKVTDTKIPAYEGNTVRSESLSALLTLGFNRKVAEKAVDKVLQDQGNSTSVEQVIKEALGHLAS